MEYNETSRNIVYLCVCVCVCAYVHLCVYFTQHNQVNYMQILMHVCLYLLHISLSLWHTNTAQVFYQQPTYNVASIDLSMHTQQT